MIIDGCYIKNFHIDERRQIVDMSPEWYIINNLPFGSKAESIIVEGLHADISIYIPLRNRAVVGPLFDLYKANKSIILTLEEST